MKKFHLICPLCGSWVNWLYNCILKVDNHKNFFEKILTKSSLAELLYIAWMKQEMSIKQDSERFRRFVYLVDKVAEQGERIAIRLQIKLHNTYKNELSTEYN